MRIRALVLLLSYFIMFGGPSAAMAQEAFYTLSERSVLFVVDSTGKPLGPVYDGYLESPSVRIGFVDGSKVYDVSVGVQRTSVYSEETWVSYLTDDCSGVPYVWWGPDRLIQRAVVDDVGDVWVPTGAPVTIARGSSRSWTPDAPSQCNTSLDASPYTHMQLQRTSTNFYDRFPPPYSLQVMSID